MNIENNEFLKVQFHMKEKEALLAIEMSRWSHLKRNENSKKLTFEKLIAVVPFDDWNRPTFTTLTPQGNLGTIVYWSQDLSSFKSCFCIFIDNTNVHWLNWNKNWKYKIINICLFRIQIYFFYLFTLVNNLLTISIWDT